MVKYCTNLEQINVCQHLTKNKGCGYCKTGKEIYNNDALHPKNFCIDAYYAVYPYLLALLYNAKFGKQLDKNEIVVSCPNASDPTLLKISYRFKKIKFILNIAEKIFRKLGFPKDAIDKLIKLEVLNSGNNCALKKGDECEIKIPDIKELCPASFFSVYPLIHLYNRNESLKKYGADRIKFFCPDSATDIAYSVNFNENSCQNCTSCPKAIQSSNNQFFCLPDLSQFTITSLNDVKCENKLWQKREITLKELMPDSLCPYVFNIAIPYITTFQNGGYFKWSKDINSAQVQCPNPGGKVEFMISRDPNDKSKTSLTVKKTKNYCLLKHKENQVFNFDFSKIICLHLFTRIFPYLLLLEYNKETDIYKDGITVSCPFKNDIKYVITKNII
ncbi:MAG: hypothetical protein QMD86_00150 [Patescibacteria group bacterium]|nr:hypothetical protein [Patescibacteria group bacterium]